MIVLFTNTNATCINSTCIMHVADLISVVRTPSLDLIIIKLCTLGIFCHVRPTDSFNILLITSRTHPEGPDTHTFETNVPPLPPPENLRIYNYSGFRSSHGDTIQNIAKSRYTYMYIYMHILQGHEGKCLRGVQFR